MFVNLLVSNNHYFTSRCYVR